METTYIAETQGVYLEDSYFLGFVAEESNLRLKALFALTIDHPAYIAPKDGDAHCYRDGYIVIERPTQIETKPGRTSLLTDPDGSFDLGGIELNKRPSGGYLLVTEWFELSFVTDNLLFQVL